MRKAILFVLLTAAALLLPAPQAQAEDFPAVSAASAVVMNSGGEIVFEKDADRRSLIASTTKLLTALVVLEHADPAEELEIRPEWTGIEGSSMYLKAGERRTVRELNNVESHLGYFDMMSRLINQECDVMCRYADMRKEIRFDEVIFSRYGSQYDDMYDLIRVIGVTPLIYNDIVVFNNKSISAPYQKALLMVLQAIGEPDDSILRRINIYGFQEINEKDLKDMQDMLNLFDK